MADGQRLGVDLSAGAIAVCGTGQATAQVVADDGALVGEIGNGRVVGLVSMLDERAGERQATALADRLSAGGLAVGLSGPRREPALLHEAIREAMLLAELACAPDAASAGSPRSAARTRPTGCSSA